MRVLIYFLNLTLHAFILLLAIGNALVDPFYVSDVCILFYLDIRLFNLLLFNLLSRLCFAYDYSNLAICYALVDPFYVSDLCNF